LQQEYDVEVEFAPYLLDPTTPPEGKPRRRMTSADSPPTDMELRGEALGIRFTRGREITSNSHLALEASAFAAGKPQAWQFHRAVFKAYFEDLEDIGNIETILRVAESVGLDTAALRASLESGEFRGQVDEGIRWARQIGVTGVPTFVIDDQHGVVGAQDHEVFVRVFEHLGKVPRGAES
jgi:predicted DsbA family dithiol-disulfide isomerase